MDIGKQISELRQQKNITLETLALGICTDESLRNIELGKESVNKLFVEVIFQRLGKSTDKLELIVSDKVYEEEQQKEYYEELLERGDKEQADQILKQLLKQASEESNVHKMFYCRSRAYAELRLEKNPVKAKEWIQKALDITLPGWKEKKLEEYWISTIEMENLLFCAKSQMEIGTEEEMDEAEELLGNCQQFIDMRVTDGEEHAKIFAKCACLLGELYIKQGEISKAESYIERAWKELQLYGISYFMLPLLELLIQCSNKENGKKKRYQNYLDALMHLNEYVGEKGHTTDSIFKNCSQQTYYMDYELFREERIAQGYSQEQMMEGIYKNPESLSRAERGKAAMRDSKLIRLFNRLGIEKDRYNEFVVTDTYEVLELKQKLGIRISKNSYKEAEEILKELKDRLDLKIAENRRWIEGYEITLNIVRQSVAKEELLEQAINLLQETYHLQTNGVYRTPMDREAALINQIAILLRQIGKKEEAIQLLYDVTEIMEKSKISPEKRYRSYSMLKTNLAKWSCSILLAKENIRFTLSCGKLNSLPVNYMTIACGMLDNPANYSICREMIRDCYYLCDLVCNETNKEIARKYYKNEFKEELEDF